MADVDVLVLGDGLAGRTAALAAASADPGATVGLVGSGDSPLDRFDGLVDVLGYVPDGDGSAATRRAGPVATPFAAIPDLPEDHPYRLLGGPALRAGLALFDEATGGEYVGDHTERNALLPTTLGYPAPAARYPESMAQGLASREAATLLVGFQSLPDLEAPLAAARLTDAGVPFAVDGATTTVPIGGEDAPPALAFARALDQNDPVGHRDVPVRESLGGRVATVTRDEDRIGFPAVLGLEEPAAVHATVGAELDAAVFEVPLGPPSVPGRRLAAQFDRALGDAGVEVYAGSPIEEISVDGDAIATVRLGGERGPDVLEPSAVVLATGGVADGGLVADRSGVREPLLGCHVPHPGDRGRWASTDPLGDHAFARFGVRIDDAARPLTADSEPKLANLHAAGRIVGGHDAIAEHSRAGVALASGYVAGTRAVDR